MHQLDASKCHGHKTGAEPATEKSAGAPKKQGPDSRWVRSQLPCPALIYIICIYNCRIYTIETILYT